jgi:hypothetical protein
MKTLSRDYLENAQNCAELAERAPDEPTRNRYRRMEAAWRALAIERDWLDGQRPPFTDGLARKRRPYKSAVPYSLHPPRSRTGCAGRLT